MARNNSGSGCLLLIALLASAAAGAYVFNWLTAKPETAGPQTGRLKPRKGVAERPKGSEPAYGQEKNPFDDYEIQAPKAKDPFEKYEKPQAPKDDPFEEYLKQEPVKPLPEPEAIDAKERPYVPEERSWAEAAADTYQGTVSTAILAYQTVLPWMPVLYIYVQIVLAVAAFRIAFFFIGRRLGIVEMKWFRLFLWVFPWRPVYRAWMKPVRWWKRLRYGKGANNNWASPLLAMTLVYRGGDSIYLGRLSLKRGIPLHQPCGIRGPRHVVIMAQTGSGKTVYLMTWLGSLDPSAAAFVVDCDAQMVNALGPALQQAGHRVVALDPYQLSGFKSGNWNPLDEITRAVNRHGHDAAVRFAKTLAEALIRETEPQNAWVYQDGGNFMTGLILYVWLYEPKERRHIVRVRELLTQGCVEAAKPDEDPFKALLRVMKTKPDFGGIIAGAASIIEASQSEGGKNYPRSACVSQTAWLDLPEIAAISQSSDVCGEDLKLTNTVVFMVAPLTDIQNKLSGWVRAFTMMSLYAFENIPGSLKIPALFAIDEAPSLSRIQAIATSAPAFRKYGIRLLLITQDLQRLAGVYPNEWRGFLGSAEATIWMGLGVEDGQTLDYLSKNVLGKCMVREKIEGSPWWMRWLGLSKIPARYQMTERWLMEPQDLAKFLLAEDGNIIVTRPGCSPLMLKHGPYYTELPFWRFSPDSKFGESYLRARVRETFSFLRPQRAIIEEAPEEIELPEIAAIEPPVLTAEEPPAAGVPTHPFALAESETPEPIIDETLGKLIMDINNSRGKKPVFAPEPALEPPSFKGGAPLFEQRFKEHYGPDGAYPDAEVRALVLAQFGQRVDAGGKYYDLCRAFLTMFDPSQADEMQVEVEVLAALCADFDKRFMKKKRKVA
jgi:type IV secretory pathway TraG/TraD family ATPase VirD4